MVEVIFTQDVPMVWPKLAPLFARAILRGDGSITLESTYQGLIIGTQYALIATSGKQTIGAACCINSDTDDGKKVLLIGLLFSEPHRFKDWMADFEQKVTLLANWLGVDALEAQGRKGWGRYLTGAVQEGERIRKYVK